MDVLPDEPEEYPPGEYEPSVVSSFSGFMLWINCSTGIVSGGLTAAALAPGVAGVVGVVGFVMGILEFDGRNFSG